MRVSGLFWRVERTSGASLLYFPGAPARLVCSICKNKLCDHITSAESLTPLKPVLFFVLVSRLLSPTPSLTALFTWLQSWACASPKLATPQILCHAHTDTTNKPARTTALAERPLPKITLNSSQSALAERTRCLLRGSVMAKHARGSGSGASQTARAAMTDTKTAVAQPAKRRRGAPQTFSSKLYKILQDAQLKESSPVGWCLEGEKSTQQADNPSCTGVPSSRRAWHRLHTPRLFWVLFSPVKCGSGCPPRSLSPRCPPGLRGSHRSQRVRLRLCRGLRVLSPLGRVQLS